MKCPWRRVLKFYDRETERLERRERGIEQTLRWTGLSIAALLAVVLASSNYSPSWIAVAFAGVAALALLLFLWFSAKRCLRAYEKFEQAVIAELPPDVKWVCLNEMKCFRYHRRALKRLDRWLGEATSSGGSSSG